MAEDVDKDSKTEEATEKKIRDAVEKGQLPNSRETGILASFVAILLFIVFFAGDAIMKLGTFLSIFLEKPDAWPMDTSSDVVALS
ncbi:MAG: EscU/YscU/HrcU family type III secretion system export apparatus switch protein, partial [Pseudomonadota bacterium]|nr:EscU/YscU/HrcU family type III secretion system export apparatus switch protein [Pseudomonadota bacterium]